MYTKSKTGEKVSEFKRKLQEEVKSDGKGKGADSKNDKKDDGKGGKDKKDDGKGGKDKKDNKNAKDKDDKSKSDDKNKKNNKLGNKDDNDSSDDDRDGKKGKKDGKDKLKRGRSSEQVDSAQKGLRTRSQPSVKQKKEEEKPEEPKKKINPYIKVTEFYLGQYKAPICGADIFEMFAWKGQHAHLDINHAYFHWLFPHFQGDFGKERATLFRENAVIGKRIIESYRLILDFYGINLDDEATGKVSRMDNAIARYKETFLRPYTNHEFRVKRMLQFLNVTGYRIYAIELVKFFYQEIFKITKNVLPPLKQLELTFKMDWQPYGEVDEKNKRAIDSLASKCLFSYEVLTQGINSHLKTLL